MCCWRELVEVRNRFHTHSRGVSSCVPWFCQGVSRQSLGSIGVLLHRIQFLLSGLTSHRSSPAIGRGSKMYGLYLLRDMHQPNLLHFVLVMFAVPLGDNFHSKLITGLTLCDHHRCFDDSQPHDIACGVLPWMMNNQVLQILCRPRDKRQGQEKDLIFRGRLIPQ